MSMDPGGERPMAARRLKLVMELAYDDDADQLRGALLAARAAEKAEVQRRGSRLVTGYGTEAARASMSAEVRRSTRRAELLDRLIQALDEAT
jgi:hypothetical protein